MKKDNELHIAFSLGSIIDTKKAEEVLEQKGVKAFQKILKKHRDSSTIFDAGPSLGFFMALRRLNKLIPDDILKIRFGLISKIDPNPNVSAVILESMKFYLEENKEDLSDFGFDVVMMTNGKDTTFCHKVFDTDLMFTTSQNSAKKLFNDGFPAVAIPNIHKDLNKEFYNKRNGNIVLFTDYDGVIGDVESEKVFQKHLSTQSPSGAVNAFIQHEISNSETPMELGPLGAVMQKLGRIVKYEKEQQQNSGDYNNLLDILVVTARGGQAQTRLVRTIDNFNIEISSLYMMQGQNKNDLLSELGKLYQGYNILFFDDSEIHFKRSQDLATILSGLVPNSDNITK